MALTREEINQLIDFFEAIWAARGTNSQFEHAQQPILLESGSENVIHVPDRSGENEALVSQHNASISQIENVQLIPAESKSAEGAENAGNEAASDSTPVPAQTLAAKRKNATKKNKKKPQKKSRKKSTEIDEYEVPLNVRSTRSERKRY